MRLHSPDTMAKPAPSTMSGAGGEGPDSRRACEGILRLVARALAVSDVYLLQPQLTLHCCAGGDLAEAGGAPTVQQISPEQASPTARHSHATGTPIWVTDTDQEAVLPAISTLHRAGWVGFSAAVPLRDRGGAISGALGISGPKRREASPDQLDLLWGFAAQIQTELELRRNSELLLLADEDEAPRTDPRRDSRRTPPRLRGAIDTTFDPIVLLNQQLCVQDVNPAFERLLGYSAGEVIGQHASMFWPTVAQVLRGEGDAGTMQSDASERRGICSSARTKDGVTLVIEVAQGSFRENNRLLHAVTLRDITERRQMAQQLAEHEVRLRASIAYDLHDGVLQTMAGARLILQSILRGGGEPPDPRLPRLDELLASSISALRTLGRDLALREVEEGPLVDVLRSLASRKTALYGIRCDVEVLTPLVDPTVMRKGHIFLIAREAVINAMRHSGCSQVCVLLDVVGALGRMRIHDDGAGLADSQPGGLGLLSMRSRAAMIDGSLEVRRLPTGGTEVCLTWPLT